MTEKQKIHEVPQSPEAKQLGSSFLDHDPVCGPLAPGSAELYNKYQQFNPRKFGSDGTKAAGISWRIIHPTIFCSIYANKKNIPKLPKEVNEFSPVAERNNPQFELVVSELSQNLVTLNLRSFFEESISDDSYLFSIISAIKDKNTFIDLLTNKICSLFNEPQKTDSPKRSEFMPTRNNIVSVLVDDLEILACFEPNYTNNDLHDLLSELVGFVIQNSTRVPKKETMRAHALAKLKAATSIWKRLDVLTQEQEEDLLERLSKSIQEQYKVFIFNPEKHVLLRDSANQFQNPHGWAVIHPKSKVEGPSTVRVVRKKDYDAFLDDTGYRSYHEELKNATIHLDDLIAPPEAFVKNTNKTDN